MATAAEMTHFMIAMQAENLRVVQVINENNNILISEILKKPAHRNGDVIDTRSIGKPTSFRGEEGKYHEWKTKLVAYLKVTNPRAPDWLRWATTQTEAVSESDLDIMFQNTEAYAELEEMKLFSTQLHAILVSIAEGDAFRIVDSARDCNGLESYRLLTKQV
jgi:hypothetical protein